MKLVTKLRFLLFAAGVGIFSSAHMGMRYLKEQTELLKTENLELKSRLEWLEHAQSNHAEIEEGARKYNLAYREILKKYSDHLGFQEHLIRLERMEAQYAMDIRSIACGEKKIADQRTMKNMGDPVKYTLLCDEITVDMDIGYENWESWIRCHAADQPASAFSEMSVMISENEERVSCHARIEQYAIAEE